MHRILVFPALFVLPAAINAAVVTAPYSPHTGVLNWAAVAGTASQSTTDFGGDAARGIDGNNFGNYSSGTITHTDNFSPSNFWQVDLGADRTIEEIVLWNRTDCCGERLSNFTLSVTNTASATVYSQAFYPGAGSVGVSETVTDFGAAGGTISGRVVKVQFNGFNNVGEASLSLAEVEVQDFITSPGYQNVALGKTATQVSTGFGGEASRAVDGNTSGAYGDNSVTHTMDFGGGPKFWEVDLGGDFEINEIALWNRTDCCSDRLSNFRLSVFDGATEVYGADHFTTAGSAKRIFSTFEDTGGFFARGDRVRVELIGGLNNGAGGQGARESLSLAEVQVFGIPEPVTALTLLGGAAWVAVRRRR